MGASPPGVFCVPVILPLRTFNSQASSVVPFGVSRLATQVPEMSFDWASASRVLRLSKLNKQIALIVFNPYRTREAGGQNVAQGGGAAATLGSKVSCMRAHEVGDRCWSVAHFVGSLTHTISTQGLRPGLYAVARLRGLSAEKHLGQ